MDCSGSCGGSNDGINVGINVGVSRNDFFREFCSHNPGISDDRFGDFIFSVIFTK